MCTIEQIVDNVVFGGVVASEPEDTTNVYATGVRKLLEHLKQDKEVAATTLGVAGEKGYDGFTYAIKF